MAVTIRTFPPNGTSSPTLNLLACNTLAPIADAKNNKVNFLMISLYKANIKTIEKYIATNIATVPQNLMISVIISLSIINYAKQISSHETHTALPSS